MPKRAPQREQKNESAKEQKTSLLQRSRSAFHNAYTRHDFHSRAYVFWFIFNTLLSIVILQWSVYDGHELLNSLGFISQILIGKFVVVNNFILVGTVYFILLMITNRFWLTSGFFLSLVTVISVIERFKLELRAETVVPSDVNFLSGGNATDLLAWMPDDGIQVISGAFILIIAFIALTMVVAHRDTRGGMIFRSKKLVLRSLQRFMSGVVTVAVLVSFVASMSSIGGWSHSIITFFGDSPKLWDSEIDAQSNGTTIGFARLMNPKIMDKPASYSEETMKRIAEKYKESANSINKTRTNKVTDSTVIFVLSESFSDPSRAPDVKLNKDVTPQIRSIKENTTSGLMLSSGYGGGTANLEYMALTGMSMSNFAPSLSSPYQQLIPNATWTPIFGQAWGTDFELAFHPYTPNTYSRLGNYKKFGFSHFYTQDEPDVISPQYSLGKSPYVSDQATYTAVLNSLKKDKEGQSYFYQVVTMQNHMPYHDWYPDNDIEAQSTTNTPLGKTEKTAIETYAKGAEYTDSYTKDFLDNLDKLDQPITVVFYGDHLPSAYKSAAEKEENSLVLHETDYFIWSNKASKIDNKSSKKRATNAAYTSPNFFAAQVSEHMNAKISPFNAFLEALHTKVSAMEPAVVNKIQGWSRIPDGQALYLDKDGKYIDMTKADKQTKELMEEYKLIQYDVTAGNHYLRDLQFMDTPGAKN